MSASATFYLTSTPRASTITALDADIGSSTLITINRKSSNFTHTLRYTFKSLSGTIADKTSETSVGWTIPTSFYAQIPNELSETGIIYCDTYNGNAKIGTTQTNIGIEVNGKKNRPIINSVNIIDTNKTLPTGLTTTALTGSNQKLIRYISDVKGTINATPKNYSTLIYFVFRNENDKVATGSGNIYTLKDIQNSHFVILVQDSRKLATIENKDLEMVNYIRLNMSKFSLNRESPTSNKVFLNVEGNWYNGSFGSASNTLQAILKYRETGTSAYTTINLKLTISGNTFKLNNYQIVSDFDYQKNYEFVIEIRDKCMIQTREQLVQKGIPVFDYGEHDFRVNEILNVKGTANIKNLNVNGKNILDVIYPVGSVYMSFNSTNPSNLFGGTWEQIQGRFLLGVGNADENTSNFYGDLNKTNNDYWSDAGSKAGQFYHTLTVDEMAKHYHEFEKAGRPLYWDSNLESMGSLNPRQRSTIHMGGTY